MSFLYLDSKPGPLSLYYRPYTRAGEPMARGKISLVRDIQCCSKFFISFFLPGHCLYIVTNMCANTVGSRFETVRFTTTFTTLVESDRTLPTCGASLSQLKRPFST